MGDSVPLSSYLNVLTSKVCRLCGCKDGPFLNIFGAGMDLAKKIEHVVTIKINECDDLPHKICFRCSAKVADFHEFVEKCIKTQQLFTKKLGKDTNLKKVQSNKIKSNWEAKLNKNNISNDEYCDELVKKALESVASLKTISPSLENTDLTSKSVSKTNVVIKNLKIKLSRVDRPNFPGIVKKDGKFIIGEPQNKATPVEKSLGSTKKYGSANRKNSLIKESQLGIIREHLKKLQTQINKTHVDTNKLNPTKNSDTVESRSVNNPTSSINSPNNKLNISTNKPNVSTNNPSSSTNNTTSINDISASTKTPASTIKTPPSTIKTPTPTIKTPASAIKTPASAIKTPAPAIKTPASSKTTTNIVQKQEVTPESNFTIVKVGGVGSVFTCKFCDHLILERSRMLSHKCAAYKSTVETPLESNVSNGQSPVEVSDAVKSNLNKETPQKNPTKTNTNSKTTPLTYGPKRRSMLRNQSQNEETTEISSLPDDNAILSSLLSQPQAPLTQPPQLPTQLPIPMNTVSPSFSIKSDSIFSSKDERNSLLSKSFYLVPVGNNSYSIQMKPQLAQTTTITINTPSNISSSQSILPDSNKRLLFPSENQLHPQLTQAVPHVPSLVALAKPTKRVPHKKFRSAYAEVIPDKVEKPSVMPYPVGLLCRNSNKQSTPIGNLQISSENVAEVSKTKPSKNSYPQYTILPPKTPGKIVISTVSQAKPTTQVPEPKECKRKSQKRKASKSNKTVNILDKAPGPEPQQEPPPQEQTYQNNIEQNEHFFTYVNLDPLLKPLYILPVSSEAPVAKTIFKEVPITFEPKINVKLDQTKLKLDQTKLKLDQTKLHLHQTPNTPNIEKSDQYTCSICDLQFSREKKLLAHVKSHYQGFYNDNDDDD